MIRIHPDVKLALEKNKPVVALESSVIAQGLPFPQNLELAREVEKEILAQGAIPSTIGVINGEVVVGCCEEELTRLASDSKVIKAGARDLAFCHAKKITAGTTVSATLTIANKVGIRVFSTGGIGGVHPKAEHNSSDISNDLFSLADNQICLVSSGAKSFLDLVATLEFLETLGVPVLGWQTPFFPSFFLGKTSLIIPQVNSIEEIVDFAKAHWELSPTGFLVCQEIPERYALGQKGKEILNSIVNEISIGGIHRGPSLTPAVLKEFGIRTNGKSVEANIVLLKENARLAAQIALLLNK